MSATVFTPAPAIVRPALQPAIRPVLRALIAALAVLAALAGTIGLRFGLYAATHHELPVILHLFEQGH